MDKVDVLLIPLGDNAVIVPKEIVEYILPYAPPLPFHNDHRAVVGSLIYQADRAPVIDLSVYYEGEPDAYGKKRYIIVSAVTDNSRYNNYALLSLAPPRVLTLERSLVEDVPDSKKFPFYGRIKYGNQYSYQFANVLDFEQLEEKLLS